MAWLELTEQDFERIQTALLLYLRIRAPEPVDPQELLTITAIPGASAAQRRVVLWNLIDQGLVCLRPDWSVCLG